MTEPTHSFTFPFDLPFIQRALRRDRNWGVIKVLLAYAVLTPLMVFGLGMGGTLFFGILGGGLVATVTAMLTLFHTGAHRVHQVWQQQSPSGTIRYELDDEGFTVKLDNAQSRYRWQGLRRLWCYPDVWLIEIVKNTSAFFPPEHAPQAALDYIAERCRVAAVRV